MMCEMAKFQLLSVGLLNWKGGTTSACHAFPGTPLGAVTVLTALSDVSIHGLAAFIPRLAAYAQPCLWFFCSDGSGEWFTDTNGM